MKLFREVKKVSTVTRETQDASLFDEAVNKEVQRIMDDLCVPEDKISIAVSSRIHLQYDTYAYSATIVYTVKEFYKDKMEKFCNSVFTVIKVFDNITEYINSLQENEDGNIVITPNTKNIINMYFDIKKETGIEPIDSMYNNVIEELNEFLMSKYDGITSKKAIKDILGNISSRYIAYAYALLECEDEDGFEALVTRFSKENNIEIL